MAQRYVRIQSQDQQLYYGLLQPNRSVEVLDQAPWLGGKSTGLVLAESDYALLPPCTPSKIIAVGRNYPAHAAELGNSVPPEPLLFLKPFNTCD